MPQSFASITFQLVFSTKDRYPWITDPWAARVQAYLATVCREMTDIVYAVGGVEDHVHIATVLPRTVANADVVEKVASSHWIKTLDPSFKDFHWQCGYGAFSIGPSGKASMIAYVRNQVEYHKGKNGRARSFQDAYRSLLRKYECEWDERYICGIETRRWRFGHDTTRDPGPYDPGYVEPGLWPEDGLQM